jgi:hypothetical protein
LASITLLSSIALEVDAILKATRGWKCGLPGKLTTLPLNCDSFGLDHGERSPQSAAFVPLDGLLSIAALWGRTKSGNEEDLEGVFVVEAGAQLGFW